MLSKQDKNINRVEIAAAAAWLEVSTANGKGWKGARNLAGIGRPTSETHQKVGSGIHNRVYI